MCAVYLMLVKLYLDCNGMLILKIHVLLTFSNETYYLDDISVK